MNPAQKPARRAEVSLTGGQLSVAADNSSLNQILREIGRLTGISITGGVAEERVYGKYGPAPAPDLLDALLDGTGSNVLLIPGENGNPGQLILTPRHGGVTPPNPNAPGFDDDNGGDPGGTQRVQQNQQPAPRGVSLFGEVPIGPVPMPATPPIPGDPTNTGTSATTDPQTPNGVKTPQEILLQLQQLRQQQQQQPPQP